MSPVGSESRIASSGRLVERVERGESAGTVVWKLSRFSRSLLDAVETTKRITDAGGRLIAEDFDSKQSMSKALLGLMAGLAEEELDARREGWRQARARSVERGVPNGQAPLGYQKRPDGRLEVVKADAPPAEANPLPHITASAWSCRAGMSSSVISPLARWRRLLVPREQWWARPPWRGRRGRQAESGRPCQWLRPLLSGYRCRAWRGRRNRRLREPPSPSLAPLSELELRTSRRSRGSGVARSSSEPCRSRCAADPRRRRPRSVRVRRPPSPCLGLSPSASSGRRSRRVSRRAR
jgi:hypothetical protein